MSYFEDLRDSLRAFAPQERRNLLFYILGIMVYKFGLEAFNGSITALATNRYDYESIVNKTDSRTFERLALLQGLNQAAQCVGSIIIAPLVKRFPTKNVLACAIFIFGLCSAILLILDAATGGTFVPEAYRENHPKNEWSYYGKYPNDAIIPIYTISGIAYGCVELIRRIIPRDIVHIFYELTGTAGAFVTGLVLIPRFGNNMSFIITPICFAVSATIWFFISDLGFVKRNKSLILQERPSYFKALLGGFWLFGESIYVGARIIFTSRKFIWLIPGYSIALYAHRYLENGIAPHVARRYLGESAWSQIMVGGSNLGELLGALCVFLFTNVIQTPMPWLRIDALMLLIVWYIPYWRPQARDVSQAWVVAATFLPISFGWAAGDVSLAAYIQASLARKESDNKNISALGAVMAFLYSFYIILYAVAGTFLGRYLDGVYNASGGSKNGGTIYSGLVNTAGVQFTVIAVVVICATFVPRGSLALNPKMISDERLDRDLVLDDDDTMHRRTPEYVEKDGVEVVVKPHERLGASSSAS
ncbi:uncharacterized protein CTRU02_204727 [Colletotrichum truncatum]|uniref:Uncharacterized protein n=1 Tax=Colletotrichum truncatum TaxID=5467 RepID=A0ACC3ZD14_COLTU